MKNTTITTQSVSVNGLTLSLVDFKKFDTNIEPEYRPQGPLVNISALENGDNVPYTVTVLAYLPGSQPLNPVENTSGLPLFEDKIYLDYYGPITVNALNKNNEPIPILCRDFRVEFNCSEEAVNYDLYYIQFTYELEEGTPSVDAIFVREKDEDPETDRGTISTPKG
ncbi:hypothetical protein ACQY1Q_02325 [Tenacibaculum sp. TC6]|uniref:hypothetical protein n=1 Tax=Tenacibaculum sp. TC6 TaxID=3423223 RepID=UPI003D3605ED